MPQHPKQVQAPASQLSQHPQRSRRTNETARRAKSAPEKYKSRESPWGTMKMKKDLLDSRVVVVIVAMFPGQGGLFPDASPLSCETVPWNPPQPVVIISINRADIALADNT